MGNKYGPLDMDHFKLVVKISDRLHEGITLEQSWSKKKRN